MKITTMEAVIRNHLQNTLEHFRWNKTAVGQALDLDRRTVYRMIQRFELKPLEVLLRCDDCGALSEPGETNPRVMHTHTCQHAQAAEVAS